MASKQKSAPSSSPQNVQAGYWYSQDEFPIPLDSIPSELFTHLFAAFAEVKVVNPSTYEVTFPEKYKVQFSTFTETVQRKHPEVKTLLSIGGVSSTSTFVSLARQLDTRKSFIDSSIKLARSNNFHGLSLNWHYPSTADEMANFGLLLEDWRAEVKKESELTGNDPLLLVGAVDYRGVHKSFGYPYEAISKNLDWINVVAYEFYTPDRSWNITGPFAALKNERNEYRSGYYGVQSWLDDHVPAAKIVFGLPFYGAAWRLEDKKITNVFAPADGPADGEGEVYINPSDGTISYNQIKYFKEIKPNGRGGYDENFVFNYYASGTTWIGYDDIESITAKVKYAKGKSLLGYFAWHLGGDREWTLSQTAFEAWRH